MHLNQETIDELKEVHKRKRRRKIIDIFLSGSSKKIEVHTGSVLNVLPKTNLPFGLLSSEQLK
eukprot:snap_masked-scaffold_126-processed-gene-0.12-mRNA-1 protein AED:1.00 eAED:1.00 QI:0/-1/0/0/-1/1/1/0/62